MTFENIAESEINRSAVARRIGELAAENSLFLSHYEYRIQLDPATKWLPASQPELPRPDWLYGVLAEHKYQSFRTDQRIGSFHAGQQAKWAAHELCHSLLGFAWKENASLFFHATAARLAELLPVVVFYYYDEATLTRCELHRHIQFPYVAFCEACEAVAAKPKTDAKTVNWIEKGDQFLHAEIAAVQQSIKQGTIVPNPNHKLDLASDGIAYATMQEKRLNSAEFSRYMALFVKENQGATPSLEEFIERILHLKKALLHGESFPAYNATRETWICQDLAWRLLEIQAESDGEFYSELDQLIVNLASRQNAEGILECVEKYTELCNEFHCPDVADVFSVGYELSENTGYSIDQIRDGLSSAFTTMVNFISETDIEQFVRIDRADRRFLAFRYADFLKSKNAAFASAFALEATLLHPPQAPVGHGVKIESDQTVRLNQTIRLFHCPKTYLDLFELFETDDLDDENWVLILVDKELQINIQLLDEALSQKIQSLLENTSLLETATEFYTEFKERQIIF
jgi:hypothetical protein